MSNKFTNLVFASDVVKQIVNSNPTSITPDFCMDKICECEGMLDDLDLEYNPELQPTFDQIAAELDDWVMVKSVVNKSN